MLSSPLQIFSHGPLVHELFLKQTSLKGWNLSSVDAACSIQTKGSFATDFNRGWDVYSITVFQGAHILHEATDHNLSFISSSLIETISPNPAGVAALCKNSCTGQDSSIRCSFQMLVYYGQAFPTSFQQGNKWMYISTFSCLDVANIYITVQMCIQMLVYIWSAHVAPNPAKVNMCMC